MSQKIHAAMIEVMRDIDAIAKGSTNAQQGFKYRGIDEVYNHLHGILSKHGVFMTPEVIDKTREERTNKNGTVLAFTCLRVKYTFYADDGSSVSCVVEGEGMDSGDKSSNKAMAIAHKYALIQTFCIPTEEQKDPDAEVHQIDKTYDEVIQRLEGCSTIDDVKAVWASLNADQQKKYTPAVNAAKKRVEGGK